MHMNSSKYFFLICCLLMITQSCRRKGCTSLEAENYDWKAKKDDGSCLFWAGWQSDFTPPTGKDTSGGADSLGTFRLMTARSADGFSISKTGTVLSDQAAEPDIVRHNDSLFVYYRAAKAGTETNRICVAVSRDGQEDWIYKYVSLKGYGSGELEGMREPDVYFGESDEFVMNLSVKIAGNWSIVQFRSDDGLHFDYHKVVVQETATDHFDSHTFYGGDSYHLLTKNGSDSVHRYFRSENGYDFTEKGSKTFIHQSNGCFISSTFTGGDYIEAYVYHLPSKNVYMMSSWDGEFWSQTFGSTLEFGTIGAESDYLKDFCRERARDFTHFMVYSTRIP